MGTSSRDPLFRLQNKSYRRPFARPMVAAWGTWSLREGFLLRLDNLTNNTSRFGEIAPLPEFGTESLETAHSYLRELGDSPTEKDLELAIRNAPVATAFGLSTLFSDPLPTATARSSALVSLKALNRARLDELSEQGYTTFKVKLGIDESSTEWKLLETLVSSLLHGQRLRLDPNRSWDAPTWRFWKQRLDKVSSWIEFLEEPFAPNISHEDWISQADSSPVPLALDECLSNGALADWCKLNWPGYWIVKPSLLGAPDRWMSPLSNYRKKVVLSSCFETGIGLSRLVQLSTQFPDTDHGLGTQAYFNDNLRTTESGATLTALDLTQQEEIWNRSSIS